jgi:hypothetical protein
MIFPFFSFNDRKSEGGSATTQFSWHEFKHVATSEAVRSGGSSPSSFDV